LQVVVAVGLEVPAHKAQAEAVVVVDLEPQQHLTLLQELL
jgi:hypothetical protein